MSSHSDEPIKKQVESSAILTKKMADLINQLSDQATTGFQKATGAPLPTILTAKVRELDTAMVYSSTPKVDEYVTAAKGLLQAALDADESALILSALNVVEQVARKIIGESTIQVGVHSAAANTKGMITACVSAVGFCSQQDWLTSKDFYTTYYIFVVFRPTPALKTMLHHQLLATE